MSAARILSRKTVGAAVAVLLAGASAGAQTPATPGTISVEAQSVQPDLTRAAPAFVEAVGKALAAKGFTVLEGAGHAGLVAGFQLSRTDVGTATAKVPVGRSTMGPGGASGVGASMSFNLPTSKVTTVSLEQTKLEIRIQKRGDGAILWQGAAITIRPKDSKQGQDEAVANALADALIRTYPDQSDTAVSVP